MLKSKMLKCKILALTFAMVAPLCLAQTWSDTEYVGDVRTSAWSAISGISISYTNTGCMTNATPTYTNYYRLSGTNLAGRIPLSTNIMVIFSGSSDTNAVKLSWMRKGGIYRHVIEKSYDAGVTWTNWTTIGPTTNVWTDLGSNIWTASIFTNVHGAIPAQTVPWATPGDLSGETAARIAGDAASSNFTSATAAALSNGIASAASGSSNYAAAVAGIAATAASNFTSATAGNISNNFVKIDGSSIMSGNLILDGDRVIRNVDSNDSLRIYSAHTTGAGPEIAMYGTNYATTPLRGVIQIMARSDTGSVNFATAGNQRMHILPDGTINFWSSLATNMNAAGATNIPGSGLQTATITSNQIALLGIDKANIANATITSNQMALLGVDVANVAGLGTAARSNVTDFATAADGTLAQSAVQPTDTDIMTWTNMVYRYYANSTNYIYDVYNASQRVIYCAVNGVITTNRDTYIP